MALMEAIRHKELIENIKAYFLDNNYEIIDMDKALNYLENNLILVDDDYVLQGLIEAYEIKCPVEFLDTEYMISSDNDYTEIGFCKHLNIYILEDWYGFKEMLEDKLIKEVENE